MKFKWSIPYATIGIIAFLTSLLSLNSTVTKIATVIYIFMIFIIVIAYIIKMKTGPKMRADEHIDYYDDFRGL